jgi:hypothetical protein
VKKAEEVGPKLIEHSREVMKESIDYLMDAKVKLMVTNLELTATKLVKI